MKPKMLNLPGPFSARTCGLLLLVSLLRLGLTMARADAVYELASFSIFDMVEPSNPKHVNIEKLKSAPDNATVRSFVAATQKLSSYLQVSKEEAKKFSAGTGGGGAMPAPVAAFWADVLTARTKSFVSGGMAAEP